MERLAGVDCSSIATLSASWYMPGDHSFPHHDRAVNADGSRELAFVWQLTKNWQADWGGALYWCGTLSSIVPKFNALSLFKVSNTSDHFVTQVTPNAQGKRLAVSGWWNSPADEKKLSPRKGANIKKLDPEGKVTCFSKFTGDLEPSK